MYHAPTELPKLTSRLANSKSLGNLNTTVNRATSYDKWLQEKHTGVSDKVWKSKGNDVQYNYSPYRSADRLQTSTSLTVPSIDLLQSISEPAPQIVTVHIYTRNEMMSSNKPINDQKFLTKLISPSTSLQTLRTIIVDDIIRGVDSSWSKDVVKMSITDESIVTYQSIPYAKINVVLQYYHPVAKTWRALQDDIAWMSCKQLNKGEVRLMYYLNSESEKYIHNYLEERRDAQMNLMRTVGKDHVSLRSLTEALDATKKKTNVDRREVSKPSSPTNQLGEVRSQVSAYSTVTKTNSLLTPHGNMPGQSVFYPKRNPDLDNLRSANSKVNSNRVKLAATLEDRLLKTRW